MNRVILCGRLTREPEIRYSQTASGIMGGNANSDSFMSIPDGVADEGLPFN